MTNAVTTEDLVILVDEQDHEIGQMPKLAVHQQGLLHRAFSIFIFNGEGELLLQQRAMNKYHSPGLWTNTCCSHPRPNEAIEQAASRRLMEEMGMRCELTKQFNFTYKAQFPNGLIEHEFDHVFFGLSDHAPQANPNEVGDWRYSTLEALHADIASSPDEFTPWLQVCLKQVTSRLAKHGLQF